MTSGHASDPDGRIADVRALLTCLSAARRDSQFYPPEHPAVEQSVGDLMDVVHDLHRDHDEIALTFFEGDLLFGDRVMTRESILFDQLIRDMVALGVGSIQILPGIDVSEMKRAVRVLASDASDLAAAGDIGRAVEAAWLTHVRFGQVHRVEPGEVLADDPERGRRAYESAIDLVRGVDRTIRAAGTVSSHDVQEVVGELVECVLLNRSPMLELTALRDFDEYTFYHSANVAVLSLALGSMLSDEPRFLSTLGTGALLHDIGKMTVDREILHKPGTLTAEEWQSMRDHPVSGARIASRVPGLDRSAAVIVLEHHMAHDGSGYPTRTPFKSQHLASRIVAVADAYDAMTSQRSYSPARPQDEAMGIIVSSAGNGLDPGLVRLFVRMLGVYPPRSVVRLEDGRIAVVVRPGEVDPLRPAVRVIASPDGEFVEPYLLDLAGEGAPNVERCLDGDSLNIEVDEYL